MYIIIDLYLSTLFQRRWRNKIAENHSSIDVCMSKKQKFTRLGMLSKGREKRSVNKVQTGKEERKASISTMLCNFLETGTATKLPYKSRTKYSLTQTQIFPTARSTNTELAAPEFPPLPESTPSDQSESPPVNLVNVLILRWWHIWKAAMHLGCPDRWLTASAQTPRNFLRG